MGFKLIEKKICLYGFIDALEQTARFKRSIEENNMTVSYILDRKAKEITHPSVISFEDFLHHTTRKDDWAFILCFWDAKTQEDTAHTLFENGFNNIIFSPFSSSFNETQASIIRRIYTMIRYGDYYASIEIPTFNSLIEYSDIINEFGTKTNGWVELWVPVELVYSAQNICSSHKLESEQNISNLESYHCLFDYVTGKSDLYPRDYLARYSINRNEEELLKNRRNLFDEFSKKLSIASYYFSESPIEASWNMKGYFNIIDGHHRAIFLYRNNFRTLPLVINRSDYNSYRNWQTLS